MNEFTTTILGIAFGALLTWLGSWYRSRQGNRVILTRNSQSPMINISDKVQVNLEINYKKQPVEQLVLNLLRIRNMGKKIINAMDIELIVQPMNSEVKDFFIEIQTNDPLDKTNLVLPTTNTIPRTIRIQRPFINAKRAYKEEEIKITVFSDTLLTFSTAGGGPEWYVRYEDYLKKSKYWAKICVIGFLVFFASFVLMMILSAISKYVPMTFFWAIIGFLSILVAIGSGLMAIIAVVALIKYRE